MDTKYWDTIKQVEAVNHGNNYQLAEKLRRGSIKTERLVLFSVLTRYIAVQL